MPDRLFYHTVFSSALGSFGLIWTQNRDTFLVHRVYLPLTSGLLMDLIRRIFPKSIPGLHPGIQQLGESLQRFLGGDPMTFGLSHLALDTLSLFHQRVLLAEFQVPRGWVTTYGRLAAHLGVPKAARAVGWALAHNPFPLIIPCHRTIRSTGDIGGFGGEFKGQGGGREMKKTLLALEGLHCSSGGKVQIMNIYF